MALLAEVYTHLRIFVSYGPGLAFLLFLHEAIRVRRPDIVDINNRVRSVDTSELFAEYVNTIHKRFQCEAYHLHFD